MSAPSPRKRILAVDDETTILDIMRDQFADSYDVDTATSAEAAMEIFNERRPNLVILDVRLPEVDGLTLLTFLRTADPNVPVIVVTGERDVAIAAQAIAAGAFGYVPKPFNLAYMEHLAAAATGS